MYHDILFLIVARSGSKSLPDKNIRKLGGFPLLTYRIKQALSLTSKEHIWLSTDSKKYAKLGMQAGALVPFIRPPHLATDSSSSIDVVLHAMDYADEHKRSYKYIVLLEPTSPFVYAELLKSAIEQLRNTPKADGIVATRNVNPNTIFVQDKSNYLDVLSINISTLKQLGRQTLKDQITPSGGFYISAWQSFRKHKTFYTNKTLSFNLPDECALEIDHPIDWKWAEFLLTRKIVDQKKLLK